MQDEEAIIAVIKAYFLGTYHADAEELRRVFYPDARITGSFHGQLMDWTREEFIQRILDNPSAVSLNEKYDKEIIFIDHENDAAIARARVVVGANIFTDYISLLKIRGKWVIRNKSFTT